MTSSNSSIASAGITGSHEPIVTRLVEHLKDVTQNPSVILDQALLLGLSKEVAGMQNSNVE